jgi:hypothetical protein
MKLGSVDDVSDEIDVSTETVIHRKYLSDCFWRFLSFIPLYMFVLSIYLTRPRAHANTLSLFSLQNPPSIILRFHPSSSSCLPLTSSPVHPFIPSPPPSRRWFVSRRSGATGWPRKSSGTRRAITSSRRVRTARRSLRPLRRASGRRPRRYGWI